MITDIISTLLCYCLISFSILKTVWAREWTDIKWEGLPTWAARNEAIETYDEETSERSYWDEEAYKQQSQQEAKRKRSCIQGDTATLHL